MMEIFWCLLKFVYVIKINNFLINISILSKCFAIFWMNSLESCVKTIKLLKLWWPTSLADYIDKIIKKFNLNTLKIKCSVGSMWMMRGGEIRAILMKSIFPNINFMCLASHQFPFLPFTIIICFVSKIQYCFCCFPRCTHSHTHEIHTSQIAQVSLQNSTALLAWIFLSCGESERGSWKKIKIEMFFFSSA